MSDPSVYRADGGAEETPPVDARVRSGTSRSITRGFACGLIGGIAIVMAIAWVSSLRLSLSVEQGFIGACILATCVGLLTAWVSRGFRGLAGLLIGGYVGGLVGIWITNSANDGIGTGDVGFYDFAGAMVRAAIWFTWPVLTTVGYGVGRGLFDSRKTPGGAAAP